jgi:hypothetical protein
MQLRYIIIILSAVFAIERPIEAQSVREWPTFKQSLTFGFNNSALMTKLSGQIYNFPTANSPAFRQGLHFGYQFTTKRYGLFEFEAGIDLNHHVLRPSINEGRWPDIYRYRLLNENNVLSADIQTKM